MSRDDVDDEAPLARPMTPTWQHDGITISWSNVGAPTTIVAFASFGVPPNPVPATEFHDIFLAKSFAFNLIKVIDDDRRYYIDGRMNDAVHEINRLIALTCAQQSITIGVSMGAFAAVAYARRLRRCASVIAFGAHSAIHQSIAPFDTRLPDWRSRIKSWDTLDCVRELMGGVDYELIYGTENEIDRCHATRFSNLGMKNVRVTFVQGSDHNVAAFWNSQGILCREILQRVQAAMAIRSDQASA